MRRHPGRRATDSWLPTLAAVAGHGEAFLAEDISASRVKVSTKAATVNPQKNSPALGATMAYLGINNMLGLLHGAQGCSTFIRLQLSRHYKESIALNATAMSEDTRHFRRLGEPEKGDHPGDREVLPRGGGGDDLRPDRDHGG